MKNSNIQIIVTGVFIFFAVFGVILFSKFGTDKTSIDDVRVTIWGTLPSSPINQVALSLNQQKPGMFNFDYVYKPINDLERDLTDALLSGTGFPDAIIIPQEYLVRNEKKLTLISWNAVSERDLKDSYIEGGEVFFAEGGTYAIPFLADPIVMYWNRDIFNSQAIALPPEKWEEVINLTKKLTDKEENKKINKSAVDLGEFSNIPHSKDLLATLFMQAGSGFIKRQGSNLINEFNNSSDPGVHGVVDTALNFFTQFSNPENDTYTWNRSLPNATSMFASGDLAMYFGFGSEVNDLRSKNPNLNFDIAVMPQAKSSNKKAVFGRIYGIAIINQSKYKQAALNTALKLTSGDVQRALTENSGFAPVKRDVLAIPSGGGVSGVLWKSALFTKGWLDIDPEKTTPFFKDMIESVTTGKQDSSNAMATFSNQLTELTR